MTHVVHTARINNDERVLYNDTETLMVRLLRHLLGSYVTHVLHTAWIKKKKKKKKKIYLISGLMRLGQNKTKQINKIIEKEREIHKLIYSIKPKNYVT